MTIAAPVLAAPGTVAFVNGTGVPLSNVQIRPLGKAWSPLAPGLSAGARTTANLTDDGCAYDVQGDLAGSGTVTATLTGTLAAGASASFRIKTTIK